MKRKIAFMLAAVLLLTLLPACGMSKGEKLIALTFDDGPSLIYTTRLIDGLRERNAHCTFFLTGAAAEKYPEIVKRMWLDGNQVGSHTYDHSVLTDLSEAEIKNQLEKTDAVIDKALGFDQSYMVRPPHGLYDERVLGVMDVPAICWSLDTVDWNTDTTDEIYKSLVSKAQDGDIILMHDTHGISVEAALRAVDELQARGFSLVTVNELCCRRGLNPKNDQAACYDAYPGFKGTAAAIAVPEISCEDGEGGKTVTIKGDRRGEIYYTTDGETPTPANSTLYTGNFTVSKAADVTAVSVIEWNGLRSDAASTGKVNQPVSTPQINIKDGLVEMSCNTANAEIHYTTDGSDPTEGSQRYDGAFEAEANTTYRARAYAPECVESLVNLLTFSQNGNIFSDVYVDEWYYDEIDEAVTEGVLKGVGETIFGPMENFSRAMLAAALYRMAGEPEIEGLSSQFSDVTQDFWCYKAIVWASSVGIIKADDPGCGDGLYKPRDNVSRQEMAAMLCRYLRWQGVDLSQADTDTVNGYSDSGYINPAVADDLAIACGMGIIQGFPDGSFRPEVTVLRHQAAIMLLRIKEIQ